MEMEETYLRSALFVLCHRPGAYMLVHPGSSSATPTDRLGAWAARQLIRGHSVAAVGASLTQTYPEAEAAYDRFVAALRNLGALGNQPPRTRRRWRLRMLASQAIGLALSGVSFTLPYLPAGLLAWVFNTLPKLPIARRNLGQTLAYTDANLRSAGYEDTTPEWRVSVASAASENIARTHITTFLCQVLPTPKLEQLLERLIVPESLVALERELHASPGGVVAGLHTDGSAILSIYLSVRGYPMAAIADMKMAGARLGAEPDTLGETRSWLPTVVDNAAPDARAQLLEHMRDGSFAFMLFDTPARDGKDSATTPTAQFMGRSVRRFFGPAWLATHANLPILFVTTHREGDRVAVDGPEVLRADPEADQRAQIAALTDRLYTLGEAAIRARPESWTCWSYLHAFDVQQRETALAEA